MKKDDKNKSLRQLSRKHGISIIQQLVDIGSEGNQEEHSKFLWFITDLQCLVPGGSRLRRSPINAFNQREYVALSHTWKPWKPEPKERGRYRVQNWDNNSPRLSRVRNSVFDRILGYMDHVGVGYLWIDAHCIRQKTCGADDCHHYRCFEKRNGLQAMDLVYQLSSHPVALLSWKLNTKSELFLLSEILSGKLVEDSHELRLRGDADIAVEALKLLSEITQDNWWWRAWTFQENYRGGTRMQLLISHKPSLERQKLRHGVFGEITGELCIQSIKFSEQATRLCLALRGMVRQLSLDLKMIDGVLRAAGKYTLLIHNSISMTPTIIADIEPRGLKKPWDRLAIIANCCQYPVRLNGNTLSQRRQSLSL
nr:uncharacterized protein CTRU02_08493 [Colletotrichum truncatum]KAF6789794.1 hypothetical protein CTRU02_08493 [Colletotrichum truncatum]